MDFISCAKGWGPFRYPWSSGLNPIYDRWPDGSEGLGSLDLDSHFSRLGVLAGIPGSCALRVTCPSWALRSFIGHDAPGIPCGRVRHGWEPGPLDPCCTSGRVGRTWAMFLLSHVLRNRRAGVLATVLESWTFRLLRWGYPSQLILVHLVRAARQKRGTCPARGSKGTFESQGTWLLGLALVATRGGRVPVLGRKPLAGPLPGSDALVSGPYGAWFPAEVNVPFHPGVE